MELSQQKYYSEFHGTPQLQTNLITRCKIG
jgi:hypothetical protein